MELAESHGERITDVARTQVSLCVVGGQKEIKKDFGFEMRSAHEPCAEKGFVQELRLWWQK
jgi:hypothetical protein